MRQSRLRRRLLLELLSGRDRSGEALVEADLVQGEVVGIALGKRRLVYLRRLLLLWWQCRLLWSLSELTEEVILIFIE